MLALGAALTVLAAAAAGWIAWADYRGAVQTELSAEALMARVLEDHATRTVDTAALALASLTDRIGARTGRSTDEIRTLLLEALAPLPFVRSFALIDAAEGVIMASTTAADHTGLRVNLARLPRLPSVGQEQLGGFVAGRSLADLGADPARAAPPPGLGFIPLLRSLEAPAGRTWLLVALLNPDAFANHQTLTLADSQSSAVLAGYRGEVLAATVGAAAAPGDSIGGHDVFRVHIGRVEHASYVGAGADPQIVAFRASRTRPLVVLVQQAESAVRQRWWRGARGEVAVSAYAVLLLAAMTLVAARSLRARERAREMLDQAQIDVARREHDLSVIITSLQEVIFRADAEGAITFVNARWPQLTGQRADRAMGSRLADLVAPSHRSLADALFATGAGAEVRNAQVATLPDADGAERLFDIAVVPLTTDGRVEGFAGSAVDVTARVTAQQRLQTQLAVTALMLETSPLPLSLRDAQGCFLSVNQAWENFTGLSRQSVLGRATPIPSFAEDRERHRAHDRALLAQGTGRVRYEASLLHGDGSPRDAVVEKVLVPGDNGPAGILTMVMDVSEFRAAERATREARDAAEEASRVKSEFIANISHELRTPLQSVLGFSELGALRGKAQPKLSAMFEEIHASGKRMLALVSDLLDVAKLESAIGTFHLERTDLRPLVRQVAHELEPLLAVRSLHLDVALGGAPLVAKVDPLRFQQVVRNVLANAIRFSPARGRIEVEGTTTPEGELRIRVADQGPGIPTAELEHIFDAFAQSSRTRDGSGGTGLGLTICRKILSVHGGSIEARNGAEGGAVFDIYLPLKPVTETAPVPLD